jgi:hypothetical protein
MRLTAIGILLAVAALPILGGPPVAGTTTTAATTAVAAAPPQRTMIVTSQDFSNLLADDCEHFHTRNVTSFPATSRSQEQQEMPLQGIDILKIHSGQQGGVSIKGWDKPVVRLTVCKEAVGFTQQQAQRTLGAINISVRSGDINATGPAIDESQAWWVHMILRVPKSAKLDVTSSNGGISIRNMSGRITAHAKNGGISIATTSGRIDATTENGPISVKLDRDTSLEAQIADAGEILCNPRLCRAQDYSANKKHLHIGSGTASFRLYTTSAPIVIDQVR